MEEAGAHHSPVHPSAPYLTSASSVLKYSVSPLVTDLVSVTVVPATEDDLDGDTIIIPHRAALKRKEVKDFCYFLQVVQGIRAPQQASLFVGVLVVKLAVWKFH